MGIALSLRTLPRSGVGAVQLQLDESLFESLNGIEEDLSVLAEVKPHVGGWLALDEAEPFGEHALVLGEHPFHSGIWTSAGWRRECRPRSSWRAFVFGSSKYASSFFSQASTTSGSLRSTSSGRS